MTIGRGPLASWLVAAGFLLKTTGWGLWAERLAAAGKVL
jgi:hypothetical protein